MLRSCHMTNHMLLFTENKTAVLWATFDSQNIHFHVNFEFLRICYSRRIFENVLNIQVDEPEPEHSFQV